VQDGTEYLQILWCIDPLIGNDRETNNDTTAVDRQRQAPMEAEERSASMAAHAHNDEQCFLRGQCRGVISGTLFRA
jgi:hypothetical protein